MSDAAENPLADSSPSNRELSRRLATRQGTPRARGVASSQPSRPTTSMSVKVPQVIQLMPANAPHSYNHGVPLRAIAAAIGMVLLTGLSLLFLYEVRRTLVWLVVALLFTVTLYPVIGWVQRHLTRSHRL